MKIKKTISCFISTLIVTSCATPPPQNPENICAIFNENRSWYYASKEMNEKWGTPIHIPIAIMFQESSFKHNAAPPMQYFWFIPTGRASDAYGYAQARTMTWKDYQRETGNSWSDRDDFADAVDFIGWYTYKTHKINGISQWDAYGQYLNYHEGWGGYRKKSYRNKAWLIKVSQRVEQRSKRYVTQLRSCQEELDAGWLQRWFS